jgi:ABC-type Co2+ transport system permease subunit
MRFGIRLLSFAIAASLAVWWAEWLAVFLESDACLDAGGSYQSATGSCASPAAPYVAQFARPGMHFFWLMFLLAVTVPAAVVYAAVSGFLFRMLGRRAP